MKPMAALKIWADACEKAGVCWTLYKETLLCAAGYHSFPESLTCANVAVISEELPALLQQVCPLLPEDWILVRDFFGGQEPKLYFAQGETAVLDVSILMDVAGEEALLPLKGQMYAISKPLCKKQAHHKSFQELFGGAYSKTVGKLTQKRIPYLIEKTFPQLVAFALNFDENAQYYCDVLTDKHTVIVPKACFESIQMLRCDEEEYPVPCGYQEYLALAYGDWENGLFDEIGCGLTKEEKQELKAHQAHCTQALEFVQSVSEEFGLRYYLLAGSVLGAVRHSGFIPWDDDIDLGIRVEDLERFEAVIKEELPKRLPEGFSLVQSGPNNPYPRMFSKICYEGRCCMDLWPLVPTQVSGLRAKLLWFFAKIITKVHYYKIGYKVTRFLKIVKPMSLVLTDKMAMALARYNERQFVGKRPSAYINLYSIYRQDKETIRRRWLDWETTMEFNGITVPVIGCTEEYLTHMYGDFTWFPPPWKRASRHVERFE